VRSPSERGVRNAEGRDPFRLLAVLMDDTTIARISSASLYKVGDPFLRHHLCFDYQFHPVHRSIGFLFNRSHPIDEVRCGLGWFGRAAVRSDAGSGTKELSPNDPSERGLGQRMNQLDSAQRKVLGPLLEFILVHSAFFPLPRSTFPLPPSSIQPHPHHGAQAVGVYRLRQVVVGPGRDTTLLVAFHRLGG